MDRIYKMLMKALGVLAALVVGVASYLLFMRGRVDRFMTRDWVDLRPPAGKLTFDPAIVAGVPEPARRYFLHAIAPGVRIARSVYLEMEGGIALAPGAEKLPLRAEEILAAPTGFIWKARAGTGLMRFSGYDYYRKGEGGMRWFLLGFIPVVRAEGPDITRSAAGRLAMEAVAWLPSALLPSARVRWEHIDARSARVRLRVGDEETAPVLIVDADGRLERLEMMRWEVDGLEGSPPQYLPSVAYSMGEDQTFDGYTIPTKLRLASKVGTVEENAFFEATLRTALYQ